MIKSEAVKTLERVIDCLEDPEMHTESNGLDKHYDCIDELRDIAEAIKTGFNPAIMIKA